MKPHQFPHMKNKSHSDEMTPAQIMQGLQEKNRMLTQKNGEYLDLAERRASKERSYNMAVAEKTLRLQADGYSVTLMQSIVKGDPNVSKAKYELDIAQAVEKACLESIKDLRSAIDTYRSLLAWLKAELQSQ